MLVQSNTLIYTTFCWCWDQVLKWFRWPRSSTWSRRRTWRRSWCWELMWDTTTITDPWQLFYWEAVAKTGPYHKSHCKHVVSQSFSWIASICSSSFSPSLFSIMSSSIISLSLSYSDSLLFSLSLFLSLSVPSFLSLSLTFSLSRESWWWAVLCEKR